VSVVRVRRRDPRGGGGPGRHRASAEHRGVSIICLSFITCEINRVYPCNNRELGQFTRKIVFYLNFVIILFIILIYYFIILFIFLFYLNLFIIFLNLNWNTLNRTKACTCVFKRDFFLKIIYNCNYQISTSNSIRCLIFQS